MGPGTNTSETWPPKPALERYNAELLTRGSTDSAPCDDMGKIGAGQDIAEEEVCLSSDDDGDSHGQGLSVARRALLLEAEIQVVEGSSTETSESTGLAHRNDAGVPASRRHARPSLPAIAERPEACASSTEDGGQPSPTPTLASTTQDFRFSRTGTLETITTVTTVCDDDGIEKHGLDRDSPPVRMPSGVTLYSDSETSSSSSESDYAPHESVPVIEITFDTSGPTSPSLRRVPARPDLNKEVSKHERPVRDDLRESMLDGISDHRGMTIKHADHEAHQAWVARLQPSVSEQVSDLSHAAPGLTSTRTSWWSDDSSVAERKAASDREDGLEMLHSVQPWFQQARAEHVQEGLDAVPDCFPDPRDAAFDSRLNDTSLSVSPETSIASVNGSLDSSGTGNGLSPTVHHTTPLDPIDEDAPTSHGAPIRPKATAVLFVDGTELGKERVGLDPAPAPGSAVEKSSDGGPAGTKRTEEQIRVAELQYRLEQLDRRQGRASCGRKTWWELERERFGRGREKLRRMRGLRVTASASGDASTDGGQAGSTGGSVSKTERFRSLLQQVPDLRPLGGEGGFGEIRWKGNA